MVEATYEPDTTVAEVAQCFEVSPAQLYSWRRQIAEGTLDQRHRSTPSFARVELAPQDLAPPVLQMPVCTTPGSIELTLPDGAHVVIEGVIDPAIIERVIAALRA